MKVVVDDARCVGHGVCESIADDVFEVGDDGVSRVLADPVPVGREGDVEAAVRQCPARALAVRQ